MKKLLTTIAATLAVALSSAASAQSAPAGFEGVWRTKEWFGTIADMRFVTCSDGPICIQVVGLPKGDGFAIGDMFMTSLTPQGKDLRRGAMKIPGGPSLQGGVFWMSATQVELRAIGAKEIWERVQ